MSKRDRIKIKGRRESGSFVAIPHDCLNHPNFTALSPKAVKLLFDMAAQYRGNNNGDLCVTWSLMKKRGWGSEDTLNKARKELLHYGWIALCRQGGRNQASLYCLTWKSIDECKGKLDVQPTVTALGYWKNPAQSLGNIAIKSKSVLRESMQRTTPFVVMRGGKA